LPFFLESVIFAWLLLSRLRSCIGAIEQETRESLIGLLADSHRAVNAPYRLLPLNLSRHELNALALASVTFALHLLQSTIVLNLFGKKL